MKHKKTTRAAIFVSAVLIVTAVFTACALGAGSGGGISEADAKSIALRHAGLNESDATFIRVKRDRDDGRNVYDVEFHSGDTEYDYEIDAADGRILEFDSDVEGFAPVPRTNQPSAAAGISEADAKSIALRHAGLNESDVTFIRVKRDRDDGRNVYDVEFYSGDTEYDYEIDAADGRILESGQERD
ncbi:MAG: PepSY domain-containing protein [Synergistaceae bacterium]|jgi:uncharacterized membrane protein YkoI|nr:PepSY domain-containing protein [Synergistaceae bacterium]